MAVLHVQDKTILSAANKIKHDFGGDSLIVSSTVIAIIGGRILVSSR